MASLAFSSLPGTCDSCPIRHSAVCSQCDGDELTRLEQIKFYRTFEAGQPIVWAGDNMSFVASVVTGVASLSQTMEDGRRQMLGLLLPSDFIGRPGRPRSSFDVTAVSEVTLCCFRRQPFEALILEVPNLASKLLDMILDELDAAREWLLLLGRKTAREKIASLLVMIARRSVKGTLADFAGPMTVDLALKREVMADYLGLTLETVSRQMSALKADGIIVLEGKRQVQVPDIRRLIAETGDDVDGGLII